jgi:hypothetical protein
MWILAALTAGVVVLVRRFHASTSPARVGAAVLLVAALGVAATLVIVVAE